MSECIGSKVLYVLRDFYILSFLLKFEGLELEISELECKFGWRKVVSWEHKLEHANKILQQYEERKQQNAQDQERIATEMDAKQQETKASEDILNDIQKHIAQLRKRQNLNNSRRRQFHQEEKSAMREITSQKKYMTGAVSDINKLQSQLTALVKKSAAHSASNASQLRQIEIDEQQQVHLHGFEIQLSMYILDLLLSIRKI